MNVLLVNQSDTVGGAARAAFRLHQGLQRKGADYGVSAQMLVQAKQSDEDKISGTSAASGTGQAKRGLRLALDQLPLKRYKQCSGAIFSPQWVPDRMAAKVRAIDPDVINLHWINAGFIQIETLSRFKKPIVWTLHDMWAFTGGCHYNQSCDRYQAQCGACPHLGSSKGRDLSRRIWQRKQRTFKNLPLTIVTPSVWLGACAKKSSLLQDVRIECIPNGIDTNIYRPINKRTARDLLQLPLDKKLLLFGSLKATSDQRKGFHLLQSALQELSHSNLKADVELVVFGASEPKEVPKFGFRTHYLGSFSDDLSLSLIYSAADAFVLPSVQENLANTLLEALACGTPCLAFDIGGMPDMIDHKENGYLAIPFETSDLAEGITYLLSDSTLQSSFSMCARQKVARQFSLEIQAKRYCSLFAEVNREVST